MALDILGITANGLTELPMGRAQKPQPQPEREAHVEKKRPAPVQMEITVREMEEFSKVLNHRLKFSVNKELNQVVVKVIDSRTDKVIKVLPPEELQRLHSRIKETIGLLFDETI